MQKTVDIPVDDPLFNIAMESLNDADKSNAAAGEYIEKEQQQTAVDDLEKAKEKANNFIGGLSWGTEKLLSHLESGVTVPDSIWLEGVDKFTPVFEKYNSDVTPEWYRKYIEPYMVEGKAGLWFGGTIYGILKAYKQEQAEKAEKEKPKTVNPQAKSEEI